MSQTTCAPAGHHFLQAYILGHARRSSRPAKTAAAKPMPVRRLAALAAEVDVLPAPVVLGTMVERLPCSAISVAAQSLATLATCGERRESSNAVLATPHGWMHTSGEASMAGAGVPSEPHASDLLDLSQGVCPHPMQASSRHTVQGRQGTQKRSHPSPRVHRQPATRCVCEASMAAVLKSCTVQ